MNADTNPFDEVYVADSVDDRAFVELFSALPLSQISAKVFAAGNVILKGIHGCGKTMILRLFLPKTIVAFKQSGIPLPIPKSAARFLSAGVNLTKSAICDIAEVTLGQGPELDLDHLPSYFGDFFNWWLLKDLFENLSFIAENADTFGWVHFESEHKFVSNLISQDCWFDSLKGCQTLKDVKARIDSRVAIYRKWVSGNLVGKGAPPELRESKTAIGQPISRTVECLKESGIIETDIRVFVRLDQLEELHQHGAVTDARDQYRKDIRLAFRRMINRALGNREGAVHYRVGTRPYGWNAPRELLVVHGSGALLEHRRDYMLVDMDEDVFRRGEATGTRFFKEFADDTFRRRLKHAFKLTELPPKGQLRKAFGKHPTPEERANYYGRPKEKTTPVPFEQALALEKSETGGVWSVEWRDYLRDIYKESPLEAVLAAAWARQSGGGSKVHRDSPPPGNAPWKSRVWWRKERLILAVLQLAARRQQRLWWWGCDDLMSLSGGNMSVFLHVCHQVWDHFLKTERLKKPTERVNLFDGRVRESIPKEVQAVGIQNASKAWLEKLTEVSGGEFRKRFIEVIGEQFRIWLREDKAMSYPGRNGISLSSAELELPIKPNSDLWVFLRDAGGYGALYQRDHTTKDQAGGRRVKYYLNPILSPFFQIPSAHMKEPKYCKLEEVLKFARSAKLPFIFETAISKSGAPEVIPKQDDEAQMNLF